MKTVKTMLRDPDTRIEQIRDHLDALDAAQRVDQMFALTRAEQRRLFELAAESEPLTLDSFVPPSVGDGAQVRHRGRNSLPLTKRHRLFEKRFCRPDDGSQRLFGYNEAPSRKLVGPGYFVAHGTGDDPRWSQRGAIVVDYFQVPDSDRALPSGWPRLVPNSRGLQRFVYQGTRDFMRGVSEHVTIGAAYKGERALDHYFVLVREPLAGGGAEPAGDDAN